MADPIISVENLGKRYRIRHQQQPYQTLRDSLTAAAQGWLAGRSATATQSEEDFWALKDVSFEVNQGDVVGVIGRNGAGKSTLLKILSRITEPTTGRIRLKGRVASLLEVGTGFHPELTGRENIFLNGAILGMTKTEIRRHFDEIVAFSEVERFLDTPVKHYSSGMYVRLAFAVAAHLEPEILVVDEVLAVGDAAFQDKCLGKIATIASHGRTVLFVSHQLEMIDRLTAKTVWLDRGTVRAIGCTAEVVSEYLRISENRPGDLTAYRTRRELGSAQITSITTRTSAGEAKSIFRQGEPLVVSVSVSAPRPMLLDVGVVIEDARDHALFTSHITDTGNTLTPRQSFVASVTLAPPVLRKGRYKVSVAVFSPDRTSFFDVVEHVPLFELSGTLGSDFPSDDRWGDLFFPLQWSVAERMQ
jgi:lipopolysaccharide transport system ATP-binding protein